MHLFPLLKFLLYHSTGHHFNNLRWFVTVLRIPHIARLIENWRKRVFFNQAEELRREFCGLRFCGFWNDQRKIGAVRESEADLKYYDAADDEGEVQCDILVWRSHGKIKEPRANVMAISWKLDLQAATWRRRYTCFVCAHEKLLHSTIAGTEMSNCKHE